LLSGRKLQYAGLEAEAGDVAIKERLYVLGPIKPEKMPLALGNQAL